MEFNIEFEGKILQREKNTEKFLKALKRYTGITEVFIFCEQKEKLEENQNLISVKSKSPEELMKDLKYLYTQLNMKGIRTSIVGEDKVKCASRKLIPGHYELVNNKWEHTSQLVLESSHYHEKIKEISK